MLARYLIWITSFGLSHLIADVLGWTQQGKAFMFVHLGIGVAMCLVALVHVSKAANSTKKANKASILIILAITGLIGIILVESLVVSKIFKIDFFICYQIMALAKCSHSNRKDKEIKSA